MRFSHEAFSRFWKEELPLKDGVLPEAYACPFFGTRLSTLEAVYFEAKGILEREGDFSEEDIVPAGFTKKNCVLPLLETTIVIGRALDARGGGDEIVLAHYRLPSLLRYVAGYHKRRGDFFRGKEEEVQRILSKEHVKMLRAVKTKNTDALLFYYGAQASHLFDDKKRPVPGRDDPSGALMRRLMAKKLLAKIAKDGAASLGLSKPLEAARAQAEDLWRDAAISADFCNTIERFSQALVSASGMIFPSRERIVPFPRRPVSCRFVERGGAGHIVK